MFGDIAFLLDLPHTAEVTALQPSSFHLVADPEAFLEAEPKVAIYVAQVLGGRPQRAGITCWSRPAAGSPRPIIGALSAPTPSTRTREALWILAPRRV